MIINKIKYLLLFILIFSGCKKSDLVNTNENNLPPVNIEINLNNQPYLTSLQNIGGYTYIENEGLKGIILYRGDEVFNAYDRNCTYDSKGSCGDTVNVHYSGLFMVDSCCSTTFSFFDGAPTNDGPAKTPLIKYYTELDPIYNILYISSEPINN